MIEFFIYLIIILCAFIYEALTFGGGLTRTIG
jgi:hypothetical protein